MNKKNKNVSFIIVNYASVFELKKCLNDLAQLPSASGCDVIIVNNDPTPLSLPVYGFAQQKICEVNRNIGYGSANNIGLQHALQPFVCFLNPDTHSFSTNFFDILDHIDNRSFASPQIRTENASIQPWSTGEMITLWQIIKNHCGFHKRSWLTQKTSPVYWVSGAALFAPTQLITELGGFDEEYFLYFEDVDLCHRLHKNGGTVLYVPHIHLTHTSGCSSRQDRIKQKKWYYTSQDIFFKKHVSTMQMYILRALRMLHLS